jgi:hypothetical protein
MSDRPIAARLRAADPVATGATTRPPAAAFDRIVATPRAANAPRVRRTRVRRPLVAALAAVLVLGGIAAATTISVRYFTAAGDAPIPAPVRAALTRAASHQGPVRTLLLDETVTAYSFASGSERGRVYMAPYAGRDGFCAAFAVVGHPVQAGCSSGSATHERAILASSGVQPFDVALTPDMHAMLGRLGATHVSDEVRLAFEDGTSVQLPRNGRWFAYAISGVHTTAGHRPVQLRFLHDGRVVRREQLEPDSYNTLAAARALVPLGDGSFAQTAIRRTLLGQIESNMGDGGRSASHTELRRTRLVRSLAIAGTRVLVYVTPVSAPGHGLGASSLITALRPGSGHPLFGFSGIAPRHKASFDQPSGCTCGLPKHPAVRYDTLIGSVPTGATRVEVQMSNGRRHAATSFDGGAQWIWLGQTTRTLRPRVMLGLDAAGRIVARRALGTLWR